MKRLWLTVGMFFVLTAVCLAAGSSVEAPADCKYCGMNRTQFAQSRMVVTYSDGSTGTCSINCVVIDMKANKGKEVKSLHVGDFDSKKLIDARTATWVVGGTKKGVMTPVAKWAFASKDSAEKFVASYGGAVFSWEAALAAAEKDAER